MLWSFEFITHFCTMIKHFKKILPVLAIAGLANANAQNKPFSTDVANKNLNISGSQVQTKKEIKSNMNPLLCSPEKGLCELPGAPATTNSSDVSVSTKPVKIIYFTDPICSSCWGIEPQLRKLKLTYGKDIEIEYHMGGLLPDWSYNSGGISKPADVAHHWDEVSQHYNMPIDGDVWLEDPLDSSYPPSIAFKAAQMQNQDKAVAFLRSLRELLFLQKKNITKWEYVEQAAARVGLDTAQLRIDFNGKARDLFQEDLDLARRLGVRGFPTLLFSDGNGNHTEKVYGFKPFTAFDAGVRKVYPGVTPYEYPKDWANLFAKYTTLTLREFAELSELPLPDAQQTLDKLEEQKLLTKIVCKNGALWVK